MVVHHDTVEVGAETKDIWQEWPAASRLRQLLHDIQIMCENQQVIFDRDQQKLGPLLEKWGIECEAEKEKFELAFGESAE